MVSAVATSGVTPIATNGDAAVDAISAAEANGANNVRVVNEQAVAGFFSCNNGSSWHRISASSSVILNNIRVSGAVKVKRVASGTDLTSIYVSVWQ